MCSVYFDCFVIQLGNKPRHKGLFAFCFRMRIIHNNDYKQDFIAKSCDLCQRIPDKLLSVSLEGPNGVLPSHLAHDNIAGHASLRRNALVP